MNEVPVRAVVSDSRRRSERRSRQRGSRSCGLRVLADATPGIEKSKLSLECVGYFLVYCRLQEPCMSAKPKDFLHSCLSLMIRPIADFCLSRGVRFQDFVELAKQGFVAAARAQLEEQAKEISNSRVSAMTGLQRPEVKRLLAEKVKAAPKDIVTRLLGQWEKDRRFIDRSGRPKRLSVTGNSCEFSKLVRIISKDLNPHTVRFELERLGLIEVTGGTAKLIRVEYISQGDPRKALEFAAEDVGDLLKAVEENAFLSTELPNLHARTQYDNIPDQYLPKIKEGLLTLGRKFHAQARALISSFDRDVKPSLSAGQGRNRVVVGTFSRAHEYDDKEGGE